jgi:hypothetical protein
MATIAPPAIMLSWSLDKTPYKRSRAPSTIKNIRKKGFIILPAAVNGNLNSNYQARERMTSLGVGNKFGI